MRFYCDTCNVETSTGSVMLRHLDESGHDRCTIGDKDGTYATLGVAILTECYEGRP